jgi:hypothetical protein
MGLSYRFEEISKMNTSLPLAIVKIIIIFKNLERVRQKEKERRKETERKIFRKQSVTLPKWPRKRGKT